VRIAAVSPSRQILDELRSHLTAKSARHELSTVVGTVLDALAVAEQKLPELLLIDVSTDNLDEMSALERITSRHPGIEIILLSSGRSPEFLIEAIHIGVKDVLDLPLVPAALDKAVSRIEGKSKSKSTTSAGKQPGKVLAFISCKGGSGATFLTSNLAYILAAEKATKVALLDLNLQFGDASLFVSDQVPVNTLANIASNINRLDAGFLASSMIHVLPNFSVLAAPEDAERSIEVKPEHIDALLNLARTQYDFVIVDVGSALNANSVKVLDHADIIFTVLQMTLPFIRDSKRLLKSLQSLGYANERIHLLVNRYEKGGNISLQDVESSLDMKVFKTIPNSYEAVSASINQGVPIMQIAKNDPVTRALHDVAESLTGDMKATKSGWISNLFHHAST